MSVSKLHYADKLVGKTTIVRHTLQRKGQVTGASYRGQVWGGELGEEVRLQGHHAGCRTGEEEDGRERN